jgi:glutathione peroxidase
LYRTYHSQGLEVLGFPCNQFGGQEPGTPEEIQSFCSTSYNVTFPIFGKIDVNGDNTHPLYQLLKSAQPGILGTELIKWNFAKFLVSRTGEVLQRFAPTDAPESLEPAIVAALGA